MPATNQPGHRIGLRLSGSESRTQLDPEGVIYLFGDEARDMNEHIATTVDREFKDALAEALQAVEGQASGVELARFREKRAEVQAKLAAAEESLAAARAEVMGIVAEGGNPTQAMRSAAGQETKVNDLRNWLQQIDAQLSTRQPNFDRDRAGTFVEVLDDIAADAHREIVRLEGEAGAYLAGIMAEVGLHQERLRRAHAQRQSQADELRALGIADAQARREVTLDDDR